MEQASEMGFDTRTRISQRSVNPSLRTSNVHQLDQSLGDLFVGQVFDIVHLAVNGGEPRLLEISVQLGDDVVLLLVQGFLELTLWQVEDGLVHFLPQHDTSGGQLVDRFTHLGSDSDNTTGWLLVGLFPLGFWNTWSIGNGLLGSWRGLGLLGHHDSGTNQDTVERHWWVVESTGPFTGDVWVGVFSGTEPRTSNQRNVGTTSDLGVHLLDWVTLFSQLLDQWNTPLQHSWVDVDQVDTNTSTWLDLLDNVVQGSSEGLWVEVTTTGNFNVVTGVQSGSDKVWVNSGWSHTWNQHWSLTDKLDVAVVQTKQFLLETILIVNGVVQNTSNDNTNTGTVLVLVRQDTQARSTTWTEVNDVGGRELGGVFPVDWQLGDQQVQSVDDGAVELSQVRAVESVVNWDLQVSLVVLQPFSFQIGLDQLRGFFQQMGVEWRGDWQESVGELQLSLGEWNSGLVQTGWSLGLSQSQVQTHWVWVTFTVLVGVLQDGRWQVGVWVNLRTTDTDVEQESHRLGQSGKEGVPGVGFGNGQGSGQTLRVTGGTRQQVLGAWSLFGVLQPVDQVEPLSVDLLGVWGGSDQSVQLVGSSLDDIRDQAVVELVQFSQFFKVVVGVTLTTENGNDLGFVVQDRSEQSRVVLLEWLTAGNSGVEEVLDDKLGLL
ncbi:hypothetical protein WICPIJ_008527 [Wickerhamomyces pijperi]|uniref:Uncharacterized protein n=1 Tax=Wickerhamomyces pijperi TaxID=599730 RepID=A0A9P8PWV1_WICPI|nr:hypothetical protein WICPIJ_008527 [Wickerhamomyces pijperi]